MSFIPEGTEWFLAEIVKEITVTGSERNDVHIDSVLIQADTPDQAYEKAVTRGHEREVTYLNTDEETVTIKYIGLRDLRPIYEQLSDGAELSYEERSDLSSEEMQRLVCSKEELGVFRSDDVSDRLVKEVIK